MIALWFEDTAAAVAMKVAVVVFPGIKTEAGTVSVPLALLDRATVLIEVGGIRSLERVTVQVVVPEEGKVVLAHCREVTVRATVPTVNVIGTLDPFKAAVMIAV